MWSRVKLNLFGAALGSQNKGTVTAEEYNAGEKVDFKLTEKDYIYEKFQWDCKRFTGIRHRYDAGAGYINDQRIDAPCNDFASGRAYSKYMHQFSETASFSQRPGRQARRMTNKKTLHVRRPPRTLAGDPSSAIGPPTTPSGVTN